MLQPRGDRGAVIVLWCGDPTGRGVGGRLGRGCGLVAHVSSVSVTDAMRTSRRLEKPPGARGPGTYSVATAFL